MNKKGLTFMSFAIAVICLGVVLIIVWPKISQIIDDSDLKIFTTNARSMITNVGKSYVNNNSRKFSNVIDGAAELKDISKKYQYIISINETGKVVSFKITNGKYKVEGFDSEGVNVDKIGEEYKIEHSDTIKYVLTSDGKFEEKK